MYRPTLGDRFSWWLACLAMPGKVKRDLKEETGVRFSEVRSHVISTQEARAYRAMSEQQFTYPEQVAPDELRQIAEQAGVNPDYVTKFVKWLHDTKADLADPLP